MQLDNSLVIGINNTNLPSGTAALRVIVSITHTDLLGFETAFSGIGIALTDDASDGAPVVASDSIRLGGKLTANVGGITDSNGIGTYAYQWQQSAGGGSWANITRGSGSDTRVYTLPASNWNATPSVRVSVVHTDGLGYLFTITSSPFAINQDPNGMPRLEVVNNATPVVGATVRIRIDGISDSNNAAGSNIAFSYQWQAYDGTNKSSAIGQTYTLTPTDVSEAENNRPARVEVSYTDDLGFAYSWIVEALLVRAEIRRNGVNINGTVIDDNATIIPNSVRYQWLQSSTESGTYTPISGATNINYSVPTGYDANRHYVRLSLTYRNSSGTRGVLSNVEKVAGIVAASSTISIALSGKTIGAQGNAILDNMRDILGRVPPAAALRYQWQAGSGGTFNAISGATSQNYVLAAGVFNNNRDQLRLQVIDRVDSANTFNSAPLSINELPTGELSVQGVQTSEGVILTATRGQLSDANGVARFIYQWYRRLNDDTLRPISGATSSTYVLVAADFAANVSRVAVGGTLIDALGFENTVLVVNARTAGDALERVSIVGTGYAPGAVFTAQTNLGDGVRGINYQWQRGQFDTDGVAQYTPIGSATNATYNLAASWDANYPLLRVSVGAATQTGQTILLSPSVSIAQSIVGELRVSSTISVNTSTSTSVQIVHVEFSHLRDANNSNGVVNTPTYEWLINDVVRGTGQTLTINTPTLISMASEFGISVRAVFVDDLGFRQTLMGRQIGALIAPPVQLEKIGAILDAAALQSGGISQLSGDFAARLLRPISPHFQIKINDRTVGQREDLAAALAQRDTHSANTDKNFAIDSLAASGELGNINNMGNVGVWMRGGLSQVEGNVDVDGQSRAYDGEVMAYFGGVDVQVKDGWRWGLGVSYQESDIDAQLDNDGLMDDNLMREMTSFVPYSEWEGDRFNIRAIGGYGGGNLVVRKQEQGASVCSGSAPSTWGFGSISGEYSLPTLGEFSSSAYGNLSYSHSQIERSECSNVGRSISEIPAISSANGGGLFGVRLGIGKFGYASAQARVGEPHGLVYDGGGGVSYTQGKFNVQMDTQSSFGNSNHKRRSYSGSLQYREGGWSSQFSSAMVNESGDWGINHRWQIGHENRWWYSTFNSAIYVERRTASGNSATYRVGGHSQISF